jgi:DNA-binding transcriptional LysR family regulator
MESLRQVERRTGDSGALALSTASGEVLHDWALKGRGLVLKVLWEVEEDLRVGRLIERLAPCHCDEIELYAMLANRRHWSPRVRVFLDFFLDFVQETPGEKSSV